MKYTFLYKKIAKQGKFTTKRITAHNPAMDGDKFKRKTINIAIGKQETRDRPRHISKYNALLTSAYLLWNNLLIILNLVTQNVHKKFDTKTNNIFWSSSGTW